MPFTQRKRPKISVVITAFNEGDEVRHTIESILSAQPDIHEILLVDDGSTDGCCDLNHSIGTVRLIRHPNRAGIVHSRHEASLLAEGDVLAYFDAHQRVESDSLQQCGILAFSQNAIVCPDICGLNSERLTHGAYFRICPKQSYFSATWKQRTPRETITRITSLKAPAYFIPKSVYSRIHWSPLLRGWGASEAAVSLKAFFTGVDILHLCGPLIRHQFKKSFHYDVGWPEIWRNQAIVARICFEDRTWYEYWLPELFEPNLSDEVKLELESDAIKTEQAEFAKVKIRSDRDFWKRLIFQNLPAALS